MPANRTVGIVGVGRMGGPIAQRYLKARVPLMVWDEAEACRAPFEKKRGVTIASPGEMAEKCAIILFVVPSSAEIADCFKGKEGVLKRARKGLVLYDLTTSNPAVTKKLAARAARAGIPYLDAGMSGGPGGILKGKLTLMIGGDEKVFKRTRKHLDPFTDKLFHLGELGTGHAMKLLNNMVLHTIFLATCEGARLAEKMGVDVAKMIEVFNVSSAFSYASQHRFPNNILNGSWNAQARIYNPHKDVGLAVAIGKSLGADVDYAERTYEILQMAVERGMIEEDYSHLYRDWHEIKKVKLGKKVKSGKKIARR
ncbi:MAG: NAD(P)-dependent oxidoreductase [Nitrospinaceae bacterium]|jgi:3-hydroxyisobutyrate dehydrogenase|nr:NAD(P)-dependent oxidoreductase [Nitrospinaceae bacterium]MBT3432964.1 NAD(P)-dependent oxidoreductase [Nitrospinaceae bacterium]MBT3820703.1 NAD(P)-dependent oxidoreductase [Nitrospinaceae bacterium]MBT4432193.1 NAD(P)-dependent oxidoreductase [Nitrospinaceae bacterium]MBT5367350.1 NAD(P)-dependent oxidoreductase [Nitrospinaceae bacterium]